MDAATERLLKELEEQGLVGDDRVREKEEAPVDVPFSQKLLDESRQIAGTLAEAESHFGALTRALIEAGKRIHTLKGMLEEVEQSVQE